MTGVAHGLRDRVRGSLRRTWALVRKETRQVVRDPSSIAVGVVLPLILILLFGYGLSLDVQHVGVAVVLEDPAPEAAELAAGFQLSPSFSAHVVRSMSDAEHLLQTGDVDGIVRVRSDFTRRLALGDVTVQLVVNGVDGNRARIIEGYSQGAIGEWAARRAAEGFGGAVEPVIVQDRMWFNEANDSHYFLVPGLIVLVMTLIGALLTSMVMAREWERGTLEAMFVTPVRPGEILLGKIVPYFFLGMIGLALRTLGPVNLVALGIGLLISTTTKSQFVASQITLVATFLPAFLLSGFMFDLRSMPTPVRLLTYILPARYYVTLLQTIFLAGNVWGIVLPDAAVLATMAALLLLLARVLTRKTLA